jgi:hypothetical protein
MPRDGAAGNFWFSKARPLRSCCSFGCSMSCSAFCWHAGLGSLVPDLVACVKGILSAVPMRRQHCPITLAKSSFDVRARKSTICYCRADPCTLVAPF